ncbi:hypothetical protein K488DRAFT_74444 [Vararia minispora EC-137]|uniref:Uncharacterized protein n=1 Tax=Vararia minispora EC-137 TaxID=1314806 RepID=A0ACB8Q7D9_9AGAM|nr:hypothetical protein K488DRAFT_74444 [Vararia minispora EC-137]
MADPTDSPPCPTCKAALVNAHPGQCYYPPVRWTSEQVRAEKEDIASKKAAADKKVVQAQNESMQKLAMLNDKLTSKDIMAAHSAQEGSQECSSKDDNHGHLVSGSRSTEKDPEEKGRHGHCATSDHGGSSIKA